MIIGVVKIVLGIFYLIFPHAFLRSMGHSVPMNDINYPLGMLAARFLGYGAGMFVIAKTPNEHRFWIMNMVFIKYSNSPLESSIRSMARLHAVCQVFPCSTSR